ncbi:unnamed protein product [Hydatigera taeniaeformis]|uniref:Intraflagellar transport protein 46 homolog n=1 Tax=Hydatigena taeniaeformis TaxID=6205 RepID=A0A0R3WWZ8_HYDTA|nr:unnamed protein product [Hydatigera taeniaeformis]
MEPFAYEDYSDFDADELDFDPSPRKTTTATIVPRPHRSSSPFELDSKSSIGLPLEKTNCVKVKCC